MLISIIIPVFNAEKYIIRCLDSIIMQDYKEIEIILVNDGSKDESENICSYYAQKDNRIKIYSRDNRGVSASRNDGLNIAKGDYVLFIDSDDYLAENALNIIYDELENNNPDLAIFGFQYEFQDENIIYSNIPEEYFNGSSEEFYSLFFEEFIKREFLNSPWNKAISRRVLTKYSLKFNEEFSICEDMAFNMELLQKVNSISIINQSLYHYVLKNSGSLVFKYHSNYFEALKYYDKMAFDYIQFIQTESGNNTLLDRVFLEKTLMFIKRIYLDSGMSNDDIRKRMISIVSDKRFSEVLNKRIETSKKRRILVWLLKHKFYNLVDIIYRVSHFLQDRWIL